MNDVVADSRQGINANRLLWAGFMAILAAGVGFAIRGGIVDAWRAEFGFTGKEVGDINGGGFTGFCFGIIIGGILADMIGYGWLVAAAFFFHILSAVVTLAATGGTSGMEKETAYNLLKWGTFIFALANGTLEAVANPLIATIFPHNRTHYLNILHASWPGGLILGGIAGAVLGENFSWPWKWQVALFLIPTVLYGLMFMGQRMPKSEASAKGLSLGQMFKDVGILGALVVCFLLMLFCKNSLNLGSLIGQPYGDYLSYGIAGACLLAVAVITNFSMGAWLLFILFIAHALVGAVELGTDLWIQNITGNILTPLIGKWLFVYTSLVMFLLRFCADFIEKRIGLSPVGILLCCAVLACIGLRLISLADTTILVMLALLVYAVGKTFFWPTMLAVASDRFPRTGAVAISFMGGIGMMSAGLIGAPGLGYFKDRYAGEELKAASATLYTEYQADKPSKFLNFEDAYGLDGKKLGDAKDALKKAREQTTGAGSPLEQLTKEQQTVLKSDIGGDRRTLVADSWIPATMAVIYLGLLLYFKSIGGYRPVHIDGPSNGGEGSG
jgi:MFS family permease